ncbi:hypothetical protein J6590_004313 [Homalodisca vitripennis]|nr:hypothetical protein J6590_004313 [Homalodisca vitripennis]
MERIMVICRFTEPRDFAFHVENRESRCGTAHSTSITRWSDLVGNSCKAADLVVITRAFRFHHFPIQVPKILSPRIYGVLGHERDPGEMPCILRPQIFV